MNGPLGAGDWFVMVLFALVWAAGTVYLFLHPSPATFVTWAALFATLGTIYHWLLIRDQKIPDATRGAG